MGKLRDVYSNVENPLDNEEVLQQIVSAYEKSDRTNLFSSSNLYSSLVKMNKTKDDSGINLSDKEAFLVESYNQWIENMINLDDAHIKYLEKSKGMDAKAVQQYLRSFGKVSSMEDIKRLKSNPLFEKEINGWELKDGWEHIKSQYISGRTESRIPIKHRLYVGCQNQDMWNLARLFKNKCEEQGIPFYFKLGQSSDRDDKMVIYADTDNLGNYISTLQEIAKENPEILQRCGEPPALTGKIDNWIGIGDEPPLKEDGKNQSYNELRAHIFEDAIEETILSEIADFKGKDITYKGKQTTFNDLFKEQAAQTIINKFSRNSSSKNFSNYGLKEEDFTTPKLKEYIKGHLSKSIKKGLDKLIEVKEKKEQLAGTNSQAIFSIPTREGKKIDVNTYDMDAIIKSMVPIMQEIDPNFMDKVKSNIQDKCKQNGIDDTFCFQQGSKERFEEADRAQLENSNSEEIAKTQPVEEVKEVYTNTDTQEQHSNNIRSIEIVKSLNPELMKKRVKLPNGAEISATQYVQEVVAPHIPSNGKFILKSNGVTISAKQFIEEAVMFEGQEKYNGDIEALLEEMTVPNNGTININGEQINSIDIVNSLNPELMKRRVKLPNGAEISATQYVQEVVAPHIPSNGKFILKSNGIGISAKQFIEEAVMFEGQEKYNGDIKALLEAMTVPNNGTLENEDKGLIEHHGLKPKTEESKAEDEKTIQGKKISITDVKTAVIQGKVTTAETQKATNEIGNVYAIKKLQQRRQMGEELTEEQQIQVEEYEKRKESIIQQYETHENNKGVSMGL